MRLFFGSLGGGGGSVTPPINYMDYDYLYIPLYGQSLSLNNSATPTIDPVSSYSYMFGTSLTGTVGGGDVLNPLIKQNDTLTEMFEVIADLRPAGITSKLVGITPGLGGTTTVNLSRGTAPYAKLIGGITRLKAIADSEGKTVICPFIPYVQGEEEMRSDMDNTTYNDHIQTLQGQLETDIKAITGQVEDIPLLISQVASNTSYLRYPRIAIEQLYEANNNPKIYLTKAMYMGDYASVTNVHGATQLYALNGAKFGYWGHRSILSKTGDVSHIKITSHSYSSLKSTITFDVPYPPLEFDTTEVNPLPDSNYGFKLFNVYEDPTNWANNTISAPVVSITNVSLTGSNTVEITYSADPSGSVLTYGVFDSTGKWANVTGGGFGTGNNGRTLGNRGNLRDSMGNTFVRNIKDSVGATQHDAIHNYCPIFEIQL